MKHRDVIEASHGTCYNLYSFNEFCCSKCGAEILVSGDSIDDSPLWFDGEQVNEPNYCPMCGRAVVTKERYEFLTPPYKWGK